MRFLPDSVQRGRHKAGESVLPYLELVVGPKTVRFHDSGRLSVKRVESLYIKEPTTIAWLDAMGPDDVLVDIGANVGMYSIYAAVLRGCQVISFEPSALNYAELNKNIQLNKIAARATAFCCAMTDEPVKLDTLYLSAFSPAHAHNDFGENRWSGPVTKLARSAKARPRQGCVGFSLDYLVETGQIPTPTHIKIDVDGLEHRVMAGLTRTLDRPELKSVLVETDFAIPESLQIAPAMLARGWRYSEHQVCLSRQYTLSAAELEQRRQEGKGGCNYIWYRGETYDKLFRRFYKTWHASLPQIRKMEREYKARGRL